MLQKMQDKHLFEYAIIRVVPRVEREEFVNVGVILFCAKKKFLKCKIHSDAQKLEVMCKELDLEELNKNLNAIKTICAGGKHSGPIGQLDLASKFRWLTATRSTVVQSSKVHPGFCDEPELMLERLQEQFVL
jgi:hypothetical protein